MKTEIQLSMEDVKCFFAHRFGVNPSCVDVVCFAVSGVAPDNLDVKVVITKEQPIEYNDNCGPYNVPFGYRTDVTTASNCADGG